MQLAEKGGIKPGFGMTAEFFLGQKDFILSSKKALKAEELIKRMLPQLTSRHRGAKNNVS
ncbi:MAG: hypothetical protein ICV63_11475 [Coleofasciculus sp. Co-bin14]|jgi:hypothetical protein|nr:hypothetical protein [Coleofasciculus sp. Co-bin14]